MGVLSVTRDIFDKSKNYLYAVFQQGKPTLDADSNDNNECLFSQIRDLSYYLGCNGFLSSGFEVVEYPANNINNFAVTAGMGYVQGYRAYLESSSQAILTSTGGWSNRTLSCVASAISTTVLGDDKMNWVANEHTNKTCYVLRQSDMTVISYTIASNSSTALTMQLTDNLLIDGITTNDPYFIQVSTPAVSRTDLICLNCFIDTVSAGEDSELYHPLAGGLEFAQRRKFRTVIEVVEGVSTLTPTSSLPSNYTDSVGNYHYYMSLASTHRSNSILLSSHITDQRTAFSQLFDYVLKAGDTWTGDMVTTNKITGTGCEIDFGHSTIKDFNSIEADSLEITESSVNAVALTVSTPDGISDQRRMFVRDTANDRRALCSVGYPIESFDAATLGTVQDQIQCHTHQIYLERTALSQMLARWTEAEILSAVQEKYTHDYMANGEFVSWSHGLDSDFLRMHSLMSPSTGSYTDMWIDGTGSLTLVLEDANTMLVVNDSGANLDGDRIRVFAAHTQLNLVITIQAAMSAAMFEDSNAGVVIAT